MKRLKMIDVSLKWRNINRHNRTVIANPIDQELFPLEKVKVGRCTYGALHVVPYNKTDGNLLIGDFCSIAKNVKFLLGGNHDYKRFSTYPFKLLFGWPGCSTSKGNITVGNDVWIGENTLILSGVSIGQGAVIAANTVVSKDVLPYEIVGGNPMRHIKWRFSEGVINELIKINISKLSTNYIQQNRNMFELSLNDENIETFINNLPQEAINNQL